jgi:hypothetical protein
MQYIFLCTRNLGDSGGISGIIPCILAWGTIVDGGIDVYHDCATS